MLLVLRKLAVGSRQACDCIGGRSNGFGHKLEEVPDDEENAWVKLHPPTHTHTLPNPPHQMSSVTVLSKNTRLASRLLQADNTKIVSHSPVPHLHCFAKALPVFWHLFTPGFFCLFLDVLEFFPPL